MTQSTERIAALRAEYRAIHELMIEDAVPLPEQDALHNRETAIVRELRALGAEP